MSKHYIRLDGVFIIKSFSDAFEEAIENDICINEDGQRHFEYNGVTNPTVMDGIFSLYKYVGENIIPATKEEQPQYDDYIASQTRVAEIQTARETLGLTEITVTEAEAWVTAKLMEAYESVELVIDVATAKAAMTKILLAVQEKNHKEIPYLLK